MSEPHDSTNWTGPIEFDERRPRWPTHGAGAPSTSSAYVMAQRSGQASEREPPEVSAIRIRAALLLLSPVSLYIAWRALRAASSDQLIASNSGPLLIWSGAAIAIALWQISSASVRLALVRRQVLELLTAATVVIAIGYVYVGLKSKGEAVESTPERAFVFFSSEGSGPFSHSAYGYERADGSRVEDGSSGVPSEWARSCALVTRLEGPRGFAWTRVLEESRSPGPGQLSWPIRREECFSDIPLAALPR